MFDLEQFFKDFFKLPMPAFKQLWIAVYMSMAVHTKKGDPGKLLNEKRPNETEEVFQYRKKTFKHITYGSMQRAMDELYRIINAINYKVNAPDNVRALLLENKFQGMPFALYIQQTILRKMIEDPNGLLVWLPSGQGLYDSAEKAVPAPYVVCSQDIHYIDENALAFLSGEKSPVIVNKKEVYEGLVFYILTKDEYYKLKQVGRKADNKYEFELIYEHRMGEIPYVVLGGDKVDVEGQQGQYYNSFFAPYLAFGDEALTQFSDFQAIMVQAGFPYIEEFMMECEITEEPNKNTQLAGTAEETYQNHKKYTWKKMPRSPYNTIERKVPNKSADNSAFTVDNILPPEIPAVRMISLDVAIPQNAWNVVKEMLSFAEDALHLNLGRGYLSGDAKEQDKKSQQAMITKIGDNVFDNIMLNSIRFVDGYYNFRMPDKSISIDKPPVYDYKTEQDVVDELKELKTGNVPVFFIQQASIDLARKRFAGDKLGLKIFDIIIQQDPLFGYDPAQKQQMVLSGTAEKEDVIRSQYIFSILQRVAADMTIDAFIQSDNAVIVDKMETLLADYMPAESIQQFDENGNPIGGDSGTGTGA